MEEIAGRTFYTAEEIAQKFDVSLRTVQRYAREGRLRKTKIGRRLLFSVEAVREYMDRQEGGEK